MAQIIFVTGTGTGVGKTLLTALLLRHQRQCQVHALGLKPIASGGRSDARILEDAQDGEISTDEINPYYFPAPMAPALAARRVRKAVPFDTLVQHIRRFSSRCDLLLVEGAGGLWVPLGEAYTVLDVICALQCPVLIVAPNQLGVVNHALLSIYALTRRGIPGVKVVLMNGASRDLVTRSNAALLVEWSHNVPVHTVPFLGSHASENRVQTFWAKKLKKTLAEIVRNDTFSSAFDVVLQR